MSYQVLARKWRPRIFSEMVGQEHVLRALINALEHNRLHHAYLFSGTRGVGKTTIARILAKCLNCEAGVSPVPCGQCSACVNIAEGRFVDLIEVDAASRTKVEDTRELLDNVQYAPTQGRYKVYLIDEVHMLSGHSFNALLKTLEEPPPHIKFLLATTDPQKLPVTILSRCLQFNLKNLNPQRIVSYLQHVLAEEKIPSEEAALWSLARAADGSMRDALSLTDQAIAHGNGTVSAADVAEMLGTIDRSTVLEICQALARRDSQLALQKVEKLAELTPDYNGALAEMLSIWHRVAIAQTAPDALDNSHSDHSAVLALAAEIIPEDVQLFYQITLLGRRDLPMAADPRSGFEMTLLRQLAFQPAPTAGLNPPVPVRADGAPMQEASSPEKKPEPEVPPLAVPAGSAIQSPSVQSAGLAAAEPPVSRHRASAPQSPAPHSNRPQSIRPHSIRPESAGPQTPQPVKGRPGPVELAESGSPASVANFKTAAVQHLASRHPETGSAGSFSTTEDSVSAIEVDSGAETKQYALVKVSLPRFEPQHWYSVYRQLDIGGVLQNTAANLVLLERSGNQLRFLLDQDYSSLYDQSHDERLAVLLGNYFGARVEVCITPGAVSTETPRARNERLRAERQAAAVQSLYEDRHVQQIIERFGGKLLEQTVQPVD